MTRASDIGLHHFTTVRAWACIVAAAHRSTAYQLCRFRFEHELAAGGIYAAPHRPDAVLELALFDGTNSPQRLGFWLECDRDTEAPSFVAKTKIEVFAQIRQAQIAVGGVRPDALVFLVPSVKRLRSLARAAGPLRDMAPVFGCVFTDASTTWSFTDGWYALGSVLTEPTPQIHLIDALAGKKSLTAAHTRDQGGILNQSTK